MRDAQWPLNTSPRHSTHAHDHEAHVHGGPKLYGMVLGALLVLTVITVAASMIDSGSAMTNVIIAMLIASIKASLVALFFMHLRWDKPMSAIIFCVGAVLPRPISHRLLYGCGQQARIGADEHEGPTAPPQQIGPQGGQLAPTVGHGTPGAMSPSGGGPVITGASPEGSYGGAATGTTTPPPAAPPAKH